MAFPSTSVLDNFNRTEDPLSTNWAALFSDYDQLKADGTKCVAQQDTVSNLSYRTDVGAAELEAFYTLSVATGSAGLFLRTQNAGQVAANVSGYYVEWESDHIDLYRYVGGWGSPIYTVSDHARAVGYKLGASVEGTGATVTITIYTDEGAGWVQQGQYGDTDAARIVASGGIGAHIYATAAFDDFGGGEIGGGGISLTPATAALVLTGYAPSRTVTEHVSFTPGKGGLTITGYPATRTITGGKVKPTLLYNGRWSALLDNIVGATLKARLVSASYTPDATDATMSDVGAGIGTDAEVTNKSLALSADSLTCFLKADDTTTAPIAEGSTIAGVVLYKFVTDDAGSTPLAYYAVNSQATDGSPILIPWPTDAEFGLLPTVFNAS